MRFRRLTAVMLVVVVALFSFVPMSAFPTEVYAGKLFPPSESFTPGTWFLGAQPPNYDPNKPPIVFVQGKNGAANDWYTDTVYYGANDMYESAFKKGYQTVFVQLYDAARQGSKSQYDNGRLLASMLSQIYNRFGKKVNIIAHSKGGPDTQAALVHYGAHQYVGKVVNLGSPHYGSHLADLSYSWWAGWLASLLGQKDDGTYSLQTGQMANFRSATDSNPNVSKNKYYSVAGTSWGPAFSALATGGLYLSSYGSNDGLVNEWSTKLRYGVHLFTDGSLDHDNIRIGSRVFPRIEPYLRTSTFSVTKPAVNISNNNEIEKIESANNQVIVGGPLTQNSVSEKSFDVDRLTNATLSVLTATNKTEVKLISPSGKVFSKENSKVITSKDQDAFRGAYVQTFQLKGMEVGKWKVQFKNVKQEDAYLFIGTFDEKTPFSLAMPGKVKQDKANFFMKRENDDLNKEVEMMIRVVDEKGKLISETKQTRKLTNDSLEGWLPKVPTSGTYNVTIDLKGTNNGHEYTRTLVRSVYIDK
ncbi:triacylglycerol lipase [Thermoactinomyces sp. DSM 45892]|uniref:esterase/lipase family protein n=1 Tax=Thermoactinomyces sp. DSM 45892 TaxID=1882753 RepID=UPI00089497D4|nr:hypothetical protein [Thermoactinomyces sp. DSM 45892]SDY13934.1 hypothetical protein SAMN05444416_102110 [Thermoactinomyces sp. DSM 45892]